MTLRTTTVPIIANRNPHMLGVFFSLFSNQILATVSSNDVQQRWPYLGL